jgi:hypothetical protein
LSQSTRKLRVSVLIAMIAALLAGLVAVATPASAIGPGTTDVDNPSGSGAVFLAAPNDETEVFRGVNGNEAAPLASRRPTHPAHSATRPARLTRRATRLATAASTRSRSRSSTVSASSSR